MPSLLALLAFAATGFGGGGPQATASCAEAIYTTPANAPPRSVQAVRIGPAVEEPAVLHGQVPAHHPRAGRPRCDPDPRRREGRRARLQPPLVAPTRGTASRECRAASACRCVEIDKG